MASGIYAEGMRAFVNKEVDFDTDTIKVMAVKTGYAIDKETHQNLDDVAAYRYVGTSDQPLGSKVISVDTTGNRVELQGGAVTYSAVALDGANDIIGYIIYYDSGLASTSTLLAFDDTNDITPDGSDVIYTPNAEGIVQYNYGA